MRTYVRKTNRGSAPQEVLQRGAHEVIKGRKLRMVARELKVCHSTLQRYVKQVKNGQIPTYGYKARIVFTTQQEKIITSYLLQCSDIYYGLSAKEIRKLVYDCAITLNFNIKNIPQTWNENGMAGNEWCAGFVKRNPLLVMRASELITSFKNHDATHFFGKLSEVLVKHNFTPSRIWNLDEVSVQTDLKMEAVKADKSTAGCGNSVTVQLAANALGDTIPPMFVFPCSKYKDHFINDGPPGCIGTGNSSGSMTSKEFLIYMDHFIQYTKPSPLDPVLLLLDNHLSHMDIKVLAKVKENSIVLLSFPPNCKDRLQPLEVGVNGLFKTYSTKGQENWMEANPGEPMTIYDTPSIVKYAFPLALTPTNICNAFKKTGIWPYNSQVFTKKGFAASNGSDRSVMNMQPSSEEMSIEPGSSSQELQQYFDLGLEDS